MIDNSQNRRNVRALARDNAAEALGEEDRASDEAEIHDWIHNEIDAAFGNELAGRGFGNDGLYACYVGELEQIRLELTRAIFNEIENDPHSRKV